MKNSKVDTINSILFMIIVIIFSFNFFYILRPENYIDRIQVSLITFAPVLLAFIIFSIKKIYKYQLLRVPMQLFILTVNLSTVLLYFTFAVKTNLFTTVEGWMSSTLYLLVLPIYTIAAGIIVFLLTILVLWVIKSLK